MGKNHSGGLESITSGRLTMGQLRRNVVELQKSGLPYEVIDATRDELIALYERHNGRRVGILQCIKLLDFRFLHEAFAPIREELRQFDEYYTKRLPEILRG